ncbi:2-dehydro-3-deoxygalactonokinase [Rouxiella aceris]|uniref:2-dehydro-3-deoxygalactonokinase n=1 Tax=Rouxiella aceris TaxID=2703884 RepID=UPI0034D956E9
MLKQTRPGTGIAEQFVCAEVFDWGLARDLETPDTLPRLFEVRAAHALGQRPREPVSEFLSGLLIGSEVASMASYFVLSQVITLVAHPSLPASLCTEGTKHASAQWRRSILGR